MTVQQFLRGKLPATELIAIFLPCIAIVIRLFAGAKTISQNNCSQPIRLLQLAVFIVALFVLGVFECVTILAPLAPPGNGPFDHPKDRMIWLTIAAGYFVVISFAMYPGRELLIEDGSEPLLHESDSESPRL